MAKLKFESDEGAVFCFFCDDEEEFDHRKNGIKYFCALWEFKEFIRKIDKYEDFPDEQQAIIDKIRDRFFEEIEGLNIN